MIRTLFIFFLLYFHLLAFTQNDCSDNLNRARQLFSDGLIEDLPGLLIPCLEEGFSREEKISAYKLLIITYLFDDNQTEAETILLRFFKDFPNYEVRTDDPVEFIYLLESYEAAPVFSVFGGFGANQTIIHTKKVVSTSPKPGSKSIKFGNIGFNMVLGASYNLDAYVKNVSTNFRFELSQYNFEFEEKNENTAIVNFTEKQIRINLPLYLSYNLSDFISELIVTPEFYLGGNFEFITSAKGTPRIDNFSESSETGSEVDLKSLRRSFEPSLLVGIKYLYPLTKGDVFFDLHFKVRFSIQNESKNRWTEDKLWSKNYYVDDDFLLHNICFNIGYRYTFYKPTKIR